MNDEIIDTKEIPENAIQVLDHGYMLFVDKMGNDDAIAEAARLSYGRGTKKKRDNTGLIKYLYDNQHTSPFEMCEIKVQIRMPIFVMRQWVRHRTANLNEYSGRYSEMPELFYVPEYQDIKFQDEINKQASSGTLEVIDQIYASNLIQQSSEKSFKTYYNLLNLGVSREMARIVLPLNTYTEIIWKNDLNNIFKFLMLRDHSHAQPEIQEYAIALSHIVKQHFPKAYAVYKDMKNSMKFTKDQLYALLSGDYSNLSKSETAKLSKIALEMQQYMTFKQF